MLVAAVLMLTVAFLFVSSAANGLIGTLGQQHVMSGQISTVFNIVSSVPIMAALVAGGLLSDALEGRNANQAAQMLFLAGAAIMFGMALYGAWRPGFVYDNVHGERGPAPNLVKDVVRLVRHRPIYPALLIWLLWNFAPGAQTPLQFYLQNTLHSSDAVFGEWNAIFAAGFIPTFLLYGWLCQKYPLQPLLWWGTVAAVPQMIPLLFMHSPGEALIAALPIGLMGGVATAAYTDLIIRSCPRGLQGTTLMFSGSLYYIASRFGDVLGTNLYQRFGGFSVCVIAITVVYALILPTLLLVPKRLIATADGERPEGGGFAVG
jgi:Na+/melibiose symporter-like transporter